MNDDEAQTIVYAFIDCMAAGTPYIGDASLLPYPKETIRQAFYKHIEHYQSMRDISAETFRELGHDKTLDQLGSMCFRLDDWYDIDAEDKSRIAELNRSEPPFPDCVHLLMAKYRGRTNDLTMRWSQRRPT